METTVCGDCGRTFPSNEVVFSHPASYGGCVCEECAHKAEEFFSAKED